VGRTSRINCKPISSPAKSQNLGVEKSANSQLRPNSNIRKTLRLTNWEPPLSTIILYVPNYHHVPSACTYRYSLRDCNSGYANVAAVLLFVLNLMDWFVLDGSSRSVIQLTADRLRVWNLSSAEERQRTPPSPPHTNTWLNVTYATGAATYNKTYRCPSVYVSTKSWRHTGDLRNIRLWYLMQVSGHIHATPHYPMEKSPRHPWKRRLSGQQPVRPP